MCGIWGACLVRTGCVACAGLSSSPRASCFAEEHARTGISPPLIKKNYNCVWFVVVVMSSFAAAVLRLEIWYIGVATTVNGIMSTLFAGQIVD